MVANRISFIACHNRTDWDLVKYDGRCSGDYRRKKASTLETSALTHSGDSKLGCGVRGLADVLDRMRDRES